MLLMLLMHPAVHPPYATFPWYHIIHTTQSRERGRDRVEIKDRQRWSREEMSNLCWQTDGEHVNKGKAQISLHFVITKPFKDLLTWMTCVSKCVFFFFLLCSVLRHILLCARSSSISCLWKQVRVSWTTQRLHESYDWAHTLNDFQCVCEGKDCFHKHKAISHWGKEVFVHSGQETSQRLHVILTTGLMWIQV